MIENKLIERLLKRLKELDITVDDLSDKTGIHRSSLYRYINNDVNGVKMDKVYLMADALGVSTLWLLGWSDVKYDKTLQILGKVKKVEFKI